MKPNDAVQWLDPGSVTPKKGIIQSVDGPTAYVRHFVKQRHGKEFIPRVSAVSLTLLTVLEPRTSWTN